MNKELTKSLVPYSSNWGVGTFGNEFNSLVDHLFDSFWAEPSFLNSRNWKPTNISEDDNNYIVSVELPGFSKKEISVVTQGNVLKVNAKNNKSTYSRQFSISGWDTNKVKSKLENGILTVCVEKTPESKEKVVDIEEIKE